MLMIALLYLEVERGCQVECISYANMLLTLWIGNAQRVHEKWKNYQSQ